MIINRSHKINIALIVFAFSCFANVSCNPIKTPTIFDIMINDTHACKSVVQFVKQTKYVPERCNITFSQESGLTRNNIDEFLCFGIFDVLCKACQLSAKGTQLEIPQKSEIETQLQKELGKMRDSITNQTDNSYCQDITKHLVNLHKKTEHHVQILANKFKEKNGCTLACFDISDKVNPLCGILYIMYKMMDVSNQSTIYGPKTDINNLNASPDKMVKTPQSDRNAVMLENIESSDKGSFKSKTVVGNSAPEMKTSAKIQTVKDSTKESVDKKVNAKVLAKKPDKLNVEPNHSEDKKVKESKTQPSVVTQNTVTKVPVNSDNTEINVNSGKTGEVNKEMPKLEKETTPKKQVEETKDDETNNKSPDDTGVMDKPDDQQNADDYDSKYGADAETPVKSEKINQNQVIHPEGKDDTDNSHMFLYFTLMSLCCVVLYIMYLSKQKILATFAKLRRSRNRNRRRPSTANYRKLDCTLEEAVTSQCNANVTHVIY